MKYNRIQAISIVLFAITLLLSGGIPSDANNYIASQQQVPVKPDQYGPEDFEFLLDSSTYYGGTKGDVVYAVETDSVGNLIVTGLVGTDSIDMVNSYNNTFGGSADIFVIKYNTNLEIIWSTYLGGSGIDTVRDLVIDSNDNIIIGGMTTSPDFPTKNAFNDTYDDDYDIIITKFTSNGELVFSTLMGGSYLEEINGITTDSHDNIIFAGNTWYDEIELKNAYNSTFGGLNDMFLGKFNPQGVLLWNTYHGGQNNDDAAGVVVDVSDNIYLAGSSGSIDFPILNGQDNTQNGNKDITLSKFTPHGVLIWSTFYGGTSIDYANDIIMDNSGAIFIAGYTGSSNLETGDLEVPDLYGGYDAVLVKFDNDGKHMWSVIQGGEYSDYFMSVQLDQSGNVLLGGYSYSSNLILKDPYNSTASGIQDGILSIYTPQGELKWSTYYGGSLQDVIYQVSIFSDKILAVGSSYSENLPMKNSLNDTFGGSIDGFVAQFNNPLYDGDDDMLGLLDEYKTGTDFDNNDSDADGLLDGWEYIYGLDPLDPNDADNDLDDDTLPNIWEFKMKLDPTNSSDSSIDSDGDALINLKEYKVGSDANNIDTDNDGLLDGEEVFIYQTSPINADTDGDGVSDGDEVLIYHSNPHGHGDVDSVVDTNAGFVTYPIAIAVLLPVFYWISRRYKQN